MKNSRFESVRLRSGPKAFAGLKTVLKRSACSFVVLMIILGVAWPPASSFANSPYQLSLTVPFEGLAWDMTPDRTAVEDEVYLTGSIHIAMRIWASSPTTIHRIFITINAQDVHGASAATGQRYRMVAGQSFDLRDPAVTFNADGSIDLPLLEFSFFMHKVDPEVARLEATLTGTMGLSIPAEFIVGNTSPTTRTCERIYLPDGTPTNYVRCDGVIVAMGLPKPNIYSPVIVPESFSVKASSGPAICALGHPCEAPDGALLFNGQQGDYYPPLYMSLDAYDQDGSPFTVQWHCRTGDQEAPVTYIEGNLYSCEPVYSHTEPITVYAVLNDGVNESTSEVRTYHMLERVNHHAPVIEPGSFSVMAHRGPATCAAGHPCEAPDGAILFNGQVGDYFPPLYLSLNASDADGDAVSVQWYCQTGGSFAPVTSLGNGVFSCMPFYSSIDPILVYAKVSDGNHEVLSEVRTYHMLERIN